MPKVHVVTLICDKCKREIAVEHDGTYTLDQYVNAEVYGKIFHAKCFREMNAYDVLKALEIDDITLNNIEGDEINGKLIYTGSTYFTC